MPYARYGAHHRHQDEPAGICVPALIGCLLEKRGSSHSTEWPKLGIYSSSKWLTISIYKLVLFTVMAPREQAEPSPTGY